MFLSVDPLLDASNPVQWNGYAYGGGNPVANADPSGAMFPKGGEPVLTPRGGGHSGGHPKPTLRSNVRKAPPGYAPGAWWGQGGSAYRVPRHYVDPRARWGVPAHHAGGMYAKRASYQPKSSMRRVRRFLGTRVEGSLRMRRVSFRRLQVLRTVSGT